MTGDATRDHEEAAREAAHRAGEVLRRAFRRRPGLLVETKGLHDYVTELDREAEHAVVSYLTARFPDHEIMAEEGSPRTAPAPFRWIVDPLDGTTNFVHGVPTFAVSVALECGGELTTGVVYDPVHDETFHASRGRGAALDGEAIRCSAADRLEEALIATGFPFRELSRLGAYLTAFESFTCKAAGLRRAGSASLDLAYTACGRYDGFWEVGLHPWDLAAGVLLVREAGGLATDVAGDPSKVIEKGEIVAAGPGLHATMLRITKSALS